MRIAIVFTGGGARGAFQLGAWRAFNELGITPMVTAVYGTSVGAINGAAYVQGDYELAADIWKQVSYDKVFKDTIKSAEANYIKRIQQTIADGGVDVSPLKSLLRSNLNEEEIRCSPIDFGMVVFNISNRKPMYRTTDQINEGSLIEFVIASSTFPIFKPHRIDEDLYLDGGIYDNRPFRFLDTRSDIDHIICVDVTIAQYIWPNKKPQNNDATITYIRPSRFLGSPLAFDNDRIQKNMLLGYTDTLRQLELSSLPLAI